MKHAERHIAILKRLNSLPRKVLEKHDHNYSSHLVLHELCNENCFNLDKAAYFVDNPEFNCTKGVAGVCKGEVGYCENITDPWQEAEKYSLCMDQSAFNKSVQEFECFQLNSCGSQDELIEKLARRYAFTKPQALIMPLKHGNKGTLLFEVSTDDDPELINEYLEDVAFLLGFCPVH